MGKGMARGAPAAAAELTATQKIIAEAEGMTLDELAQKAIEESNGKTFYGVGNSSRGKFDQLTADALKGTGTYKHSAAADIYYTDHSIEGSENEYMAHKLKNQHAPGGL